MRDTGKRFRIETLAGSTMNDPFELTPDRFDPEASDPGASDPDEAPSDEADSDAITELDSSPEASYACWACGEEIVVPIDPTMGTRQEYVEDCPVCCRPNLIHVEVDPEDGHVRCWNEHSE